MTRRTLVLLTAVGTLAIGGQMGCGGSDASNSGNQTGIGGDGDGDGDGDGGGDGDGDGDGAGDGDGDGDGTGDGDGDGDGEPKWDLGIVPDANGDPCAGAGGEGDPLFSNIWIANSSQGTVSKINTKTHVEEGRYYTAPTQAGSPSRTSVNLQGDVAVVNRNGGIAKIAARVEDCVDTNNDDTIQTLSGAAHILPWGQDECVLWHTVLPTASRPAAWTSGVPAGECDWVDAKVWSSAPNGSDAYVYLINGEDGAIEGDVLVPGANGGLGIYGGAVDQNNDFWGVTYSQGPLVHVSYDDMSYETIPLPNPSAYGFTVDSKGRSWVGGWSGVLQRYDPEDQSWTSVNMQAYTGLSRGMMEDANGELWIAGLSPNGILRVDTDTATYLDWVDAAILPGVMTPTGTSIDVDGFVWMVDQSVGGGGAFVLDPETYDVELVTGLQGPYTYSDMTGWALGNVNNPQG